MEHNYWKLELKIKGYVYFVLIILAIITVLLSSCGPTRVVSADEKTGEVVVYKKVEWKKQQKVP